MNEWQPIETLPPEFKDQPFKSFLTCANYKDEPRMIQIQEWLFVESCEDGLYTHWMPLPEPPNA